jgi:hypothetical protein
MAEHPDVNVSLSTFLRWSKVELSCTQLDTLFSEHIIRQPRRDEIMIRSYIHSLDVSRSAIRDNIHHIDPVGIENRKKKPLHRREYSVPGPHYLWHHDGYHKLIRWGIVIHG